ncbi:universal stress protein [Oerskovia sp. M15]
MGLDPAHRRLREVRGRPARPRARGRGCGPAEDRLRRSVVHAHPAKGLIEAASGAERLVVGNRGTGGFDRLLLGSVSGRPSSTRRAP